MIATIRIHVMRSLKSTTTSTTATTTTTKNSTTSTKGGKRKHGQTKDYPDSPPTTPPYNVKVMATASRGAKNKIVDITSPPSKRRRSSDRIANRTGTKRTSMEDDDGFVFTRAPKQKRKPAQPEPPSRPFLMDFTAADVVPLRMKKLILDAESISTLSSTETDTSNYRCYKRGERYVCRITSLGYSDYST